LASFCLPPAPSSSSGNERRELRLETSLFNGLNFREGPLAEQRSAEEKASAEALCSGKPVVKAIIGSVGKYGNEPHRG
jgi:hypothetical protein